MAAESNEVKWTNPNLKINVMGIVETIDYILEHRCNVARFGDGEMDVIQGHVNLPYQDYSDALAENLKTIISSQSDASMLVCLSDVFADIDRYNDFCKDFWKPHLQAYERAYIELCKADFYGNTFISRPYMDLADKSMSKVYFAKLKSLWEGRDILIVEGVYSRSGVGNDLFDNARSVQRIICPSKNSYEKLAEIEDLILKHGRDKLVLVMLGPAAKAISWHMKDKGIWTVDIGHIDSEYEWFKMGATQKVKLSHKHTAEFNFDENIEDVNDEKYLAQIVARVGEKQIDNFRAADMNILFVTDKNYLYISKVFLYSVCENHKSHNIDFWLLHHGLELSDIDELEQIINLFEGKRLNVIDAGEDCLPGVEGNLGFSKEVFYRLLAIKLLPQSLRTVLYMDVDMVCKGDISEIFDTPIAGYPIAACEDVAADITGVDVRRGAKMPMNRKYFNAGLLYMNLDFMRKYGLADYLIDRVVKEYRDFPYNDQDILNNTFSAEAYYLPWEKYNMTPIVTYLDLEGVSRGELHFASYNQINSNPEDIGRNYLDVTDYLMEGARVIHYIGDSKPWDHRDEKMYWVFDKYKGYWLDCERRMLENLAR